MAKNTKDTNKNEHEVALERTLEEVNEASTRAKPARKKTYERVRETEIPQSIVQTFKRDGYSLRWVYFSETDKRYLAKRVQEGYDFVEPRELPTDFVALSTVQRGPYGQIVTSGDMVLMKVDSELQQSRKEFYASEAQRQMSSTLTPETIKNKRFVDLGTQRTTSTKEPSFQN